MFGQTKPEYDEKEPLVAVVMVAPGTTQHDFAIRNLPTRTVTLFPTRAQIVRDIKTFKLEPGANQVTINGLSPTVEEHSVKVEGTGTATITDVLVDRVPNKEAFEDIYPSEDSDEESTDESGSEDEDRAIISLRNQIKTLRAKAQAQQEIINSAAARLSHCEHFCTTISPESAPSDLGTIMAAYKEERQRIFNDHQSATTSLEHQNSEILKSQKKLAKLSKSSAKASKKKGKEKLKEKEKKQRQRTARRQEKQEIQRQREHFWPKKTYRVVINLELSSSTPSSSRRTSIDDCSSSVNLATSMFHEDSGKQLDPDEISLSLSYSTTSASWSPRYDLSLNTVQGTGLLEYGAELRNSTSETWQDAKIILSTSQTKFSGLSEKIPNLLPWHVRLLKGGFGGDDAALMSRQETAAKSVITASSKQSSTPRNELFGVNKKKTSGASLFGGPAQTQAIPPPPIPQGFGSNNAPNVRSSPFGQASGGSPLQATSSGLFGQSRGGGLFGSSTSTAEPAASYSQEVGGFDRAAASEAVTTRGEKMVTLSQNEGMLANVEVESLFEPASNSLTFEAGAWEENGMSTTYEVPGTKTLAPTNSAVKHKIAKIDFRNVHFSHIIIGKLREVAFLEARLKNTSKITLLKGPLGLTLDGSFLGQTQFPRCSAGEMFSLPLGVDPSITVAYPKPTVRRSQSGIFTKEDSSVSSRNLVITNTKPNAACEITVIDQIPVSEDERLRIDILSPNGLKIGGQPVRTGTAVEPATVSTSPSKDKGIAKDSRSSVYGASESGKWGSAVATAKKGGEVKWIVKINPTQSVKLSLEYECMFPGGERVVSI